MSDLGALVTRLAQRLAKEARRESSIPAWQDRDDPRGDEILELERQDRIREKGE